MTVWTVAGARLSDWPDRHMFRFICFGQAGAEKFKLKRYDWDRNSFFR